ncbi:MAG: glycosyltransferase family 9 protein [Candidatus Binatia bacterium]
MEKILVLFPGALGDFICFFPALEFLARNRSVDLFARAEYADLLPPTIRVSSLERREISRLFVGGAGRDEALRRFFEPYRSVYSWTGNSDRNFATNIEALAGGRAKLFAFRPVDSVIHISDYYLECVGGKPAGETIPVVPLRRDALFWGRNWLSEGGFAGKRILALAPGSGAREKNWPGEFFREVERWWRESGGESFAIFGPAEEEWCEDRDWRGANVIRNLELGKIAALLSLSDLYLGNDSGLTHLAAAVGADVVALFGPTDPGEWAPRGRRAAVVSRNVECSPCANQVMKSCSHRKCLTALTPDAVIRFLRNFVRADEKLPARHAP